MRRNYLIIVFLMLLLCVTAKAQYQDVYTVTDTPASPKIGAKKLTTLAVSFAKEHSDYGGNGPQTIWFVVEADGSINRVCPPLRYGDDINIYKFNDEVDLVKSLKYTPAKLYGKAVASWQTLEIPYEGKPATDDSFQKTAIGALDVKGNGDSGRIMQVIKDSVDKRKLKQKVFKAIDQMPSFPGGLYYLMSYLSENIHYPLEAQKKGTQGRVVISFVVETDGQLSNFNVEQSVSQELDAEALRVVKNMPRWVPGKQEGKGVRVKYNVPINFRL